MKAESQRWNNKGNLIFDYDIVPPRIFITVRKDELSSQSASIFASITRALLVTLGFFFRRPIRLFRPVKISSWLGLQSIAAERKQKTLSLRFVTGLIREQGWRFFPTHILPPLVINSIVGFSLFFSYSFTSDHLLPYFPPTLSSSRLIDNINVNNFTLPFLSGAVAGMTQSIISTPLDNARLIILQRQIYLQSLATSKSRHTATLPYTTWKSLLDIVIHPLTPLSNVPSTSRFSRTIETRSKFRSIRSAYNSFVLTMSKDTLSFAFFFSIFETGRTISRVLALKYDGLSQGDLVEGRHKRSRVSLIFQSLGILIFGGIAGWIVGFIGRPFDRIREVVWAHKNLMSKKVDSCNMSRKVRVTNSTIMGRRLELTKRRSLDSSLSTFEREWKIDGKVKGTPLLRKVSTLELVKNASQEIGYFRFLFSSTSPLHLTSSPSSPTFATRKSRPTRLSYRHSQYHLLKRHPKLNKWGGGMRVLSYVPPYALGLLVYSVMMGDLA